MPKNRHRQSNRVSIGDFWDSEYIAEQSATSYKPCTLARRQVRGHVDTLALRRGFMLQNFQFIIRTDLLNARVSQGLPQGQRKLFESLRSFDNLVPWEAVHSVVMRTTIDDFECPICMSTPVAPRITECGHVFCMPCILQYLSYQKANNHQRLCPICSSTVTGYILRPCVLQVIEPLKVGNTATFELFRRERHTCTLHRYDDPHLNSDGLVPPEDVSLGEMDALRRELALPNYMAPHSMQCRYVLSTPDYEATQRYLDGIGISDRLDEMDKLLTRPFSESDAATMRSLLDALDEVTKAQKALPPSLARESPPMAPRPNGRSDVEPSQPKNGQKVFEMYAEANGLPYYLHMITMKMLRHDAKIRNAPLPKSVCGTIHEIVTLVQDEETRRVYKVFAHVPLHSTIKLCILDLSKVVSAETMREFGPTLRNLAQERLKKERAVDKARVVEENHSWSEYLDRYLRDQRPSSALPSDYCSFEADSVPFLRLPSTGSGWSDHGLLPSALDTRQRATKKQENDNLSTVNTDVSGDLPSFSPCPTTSPDSFSGCWGKGNAAKLFKSHLKSSVTDIT